jgi:hypothetical protein
MGAQLRLLQHDYAFTPAFDVCRRLTPRRLAERAAALAADKD